jgi:initiation factor 1A
MPGGKRQKKMANSTKSMVAPTRALPIRDKDTITDKTGEKDVQMYGQIIQMLGNCHVQVRCHDGKERRCVIRSGIKKKTRFFVDDVVLISLRSFQDDIADVLLKYTPDEVKRLKKNEKEAELLGTAIETKQELEVDLLQDQDDALAALGADLDNKPKLDSMTEIWDIPENEPKEEIDIDLI